jgi:hypothetical protein
MSESETVAPRPVEDIAREAVADLDQAAATLATWGVKLPAGGRLPQARDILDHAAETGELVPKDRGDDLGLRALEFALDYAAIADTLPPTRVAAVRRDLETSLGGALAPPDELMGPVQMQSQFVVRAALVRAGLSPDHPTQSHHVGKNPDLILENGIARYAVEVKRPRTEAGFLARFDDARDQLVEYGLPGAVLIDVTDCVRSFPLADIDREVRRLALTLYDRVFVTGRGYKPGYRSIMVAGTFGRVAWQTVDGTEQSMVSVHTSSVVGVFATTQGNLLDHHGKWIRQHFQDGLGRLYRTLSESRGE